MTEDIERALRLSEGMKMEGWKDGRMEGWKVAVVIPSVFPSFHPSVFDHSAFIVTSGSTRVARNAGTVVANAVTPMVRSVTAANTNGSMFCTW